MAAGCCSPRGLQATARVPVIGVGLRHVLESGCRAWAARRDNGWVGVVAVPLAMTATGLIGQWWTWPILLAVAACLTRAWRWSWLLSLQLACVGTAWAVIGINWLTAFPSAMLFVGFGWAAVPLVLALAGVEHRRRRNRPEYQRPW